MRLFPRRQLQVSSEPAQVLVREEPGLQRCDLEQDAARLAEVDGFKVRTVAQRGDLNAATYEVFAQGTLLFLGRDRHGDVVNGADAVLARRRLRVVHDVDDVAGTSAVRGDANASV